MKIINVPYIDQTTNWPTGCECVSTVMLLNFLKVDVGVDDFFEKCVSSEPMINKNGQLFGPDPRKKFAGDPKDPDSFGTYSPVITEALNNAFDLYKINYRAIDLSNIPTETLLKEYIDNDKPVIYWASIDLKETIKGPSWQITGSNETFEWVSNEHCMLLVGYDDDKLYFNDPWHNHGTIGYDRTLVEKRHAEEFSMAVSFN